MAMVPFEGGAPIAWGKPLSKVYKKWLQFNASYTLFIENKISQISYNPISNVVISSPFYVVALGKLSDEKNFLKSTLWPILETFQLLADIREFQYKSVGKP